MGNVTNEMLSARRADLMTKYEELRANMQRLEGALRLIDLLVQDANSAPDPLADIGQAIDPPEASGEPAVAC
jgi:hypothetical protein